MTTTAGITIYEDVWVRAERNASLIPYPTSSGHSPPRFCARVVPATDSVGRTTCWLLQQEWIRFVK